MITEGDIEYLKEYLYLASTPAFLWLKFKKSAAVKRLKESTPAADLFQEFEALEIKESRPEILVKAFALFIALITKPDESKNILKNSSNVNMLPWADELLSYARSRSKLEISSIIKAGPRTERVSDIKASPRVIDYRDKPLSNINAISFKAKPRTTTWFTISTGADNSENEVEYA